MPRVNALPPPITGDCYRLTIYSRAQAQVCMNTFEVMGDNFAASPAAPMANILAAWVLAVETQYLACCTTQTRIFRYNIQCISSNAPASIDSLVNKPGTTVTDPLPLEMGVILKKTGPLKGQHGRGRVYMPAIPVTFTTPSIEPNLLNATGTTAYTALGLDIQAAVTVGGINYTPIVSPRPIAPAVVVTVAAPITSHLPVSLLGTVRRRREGRGI